MGEKQSFRRPNKETKVKTRVYNIAQEKFKKGFQHNLKKAKKIKIKNC